MTTARRAPDRAGQGRAAQARGMTAEAVACAALQAEGWHIEARRLRTPAGEVDAVATRQGMVAFIEVKQRPTLAEAAGALSARQRGRLLAAADFLLAAHPHWGADGVRFDVLLVDSAGRVRRIADAFRRED